MVPKPTQTPTPEDECLIEARNAMRKGAADPNVYEQIRCLWTAVAWLLEAAELRSGVEPGEAHKRAIAAEKEEADAT